MQIGGMQIIVLQSREHVLGDLTWDIANESWHDNMTGLYIAFSFS
jgi:hypothetical protein